MITRLSRAERREGAGDLRECDRLYLRMTRAQAALRGGLIGSPETIRRKLHRFKESSVDSIILLNQAGRNSHEHICESLELFAKEVMPEFHAMEPEHQEWKQKVLNREIDLPELDTTAYRERVGVGKGVTIDKLVTAAE